MIQTPIPLSLAAAPIEPTEQRTLLVPAWADAQFPIVQDAEQSIYLPIRALCAFLGISNSQKQTTQLQGDRVLRKYLRKFFIRTTGGRQPAWCLNLRAVGFWLAKLDADAVRPDLQDGLVEWQEALLEAASALFWGDDIAEEETDSAEMRRRLRVQDLEIQRLKLQVRTHARHLALVERQVLPAGAYYDLGNDPEE